LFLPTDAAKPHRLQGPYLSDPEIERLVAFWRGLRPPSYVEDILNAQAEDAEDDPLMDEGMKLLERYERVSTSLLQRKLRIGYNRAASLVELLEEEGLVGPPDEANRSREVLWRPDPEDEEAAEAE